MITLTPFFCHGLGMVFVSCLSASYSSTRTHARTVARYWSQLPCVYMYIREDRGCHQGSIPRRKSEFSLCQIGLNFTCTASKVSKHTGHTQRPQQTMSCARWAGLMTNKLQSKLCSLRLLNLADHWCRLQSFIHSKAQTHLRPCLIAIGPLTHSLICLSIWTVNSS